jgi:DHA1 family bicyclomycin/chloramphenicol resistance-like MFS transporter
MATDPRLAGTAAGVGVAVQQFCGAAFAQIYGLIADGTPAPLMTTTALSSLIGLIVGALPFLILRRG